MISFKHLQESAQLNLAIMQDEELLKSIEEVIKICIEAFKNGKGIYFCGNGGSAAEAQHLSAEFSGKFKLDRPPLKSEALHVNSSFMTAVSNDEDFAHVYARAIQAIGSSGDVLFLLSTSGTSPNILKACEKAKELDIYTVGLTGKNGGLLKDVCDLCIKIPSQNVPRIQEAHLLIGHIICEEVEKAIFGDE